MDTTEKLLRASAVRIEIQDPKSRMAQECLAHYYHELAERFDDGFNPDQSISAAPEELTAPNGYFIVAELYGDAVGCGALKCHPKYGEVKRMWVTPSARGLGIGKRILARLEDIARQRKLPVLRLETNKSLVEAQALYRNAGYREVAPFNTEPYAHYWFEKSLTNS
jgi:GNAT superfamily N-acetyltransferase